MVGKTTGYIGDHANAIPEQQIELNGWVQQAFSMAKRGGEKMTTIEKYHKKSGLE
ncbi:hypothetical protein DESC_290235 [Desulfosarcina cetonica]|nr:hypothetical protein DESC_290235 [Desulfosarcina cetonica]